MERDRILSEELRAVVMVMANEREKERKEKWRK
jgi:hypothetical protein